MKKVWEADAVSALVNSPPSRKTYFYGSPAFASQKTQQALDSRKLRQVLAFFERLLKKYVFRLGGLLTNAETVIWTD
ncbi:MAG TPA: hypothetical protein DCZ40_00355 [Lachnospiraceae bacterium]|nr:hypothetical protein [Lachnospiraceae bacterium]